ncbi:alkaline phosphatase D family protein [Psychrobacter sp. 1Y1]|uniref:alkaline phosphatase D family protein n=1 Tax=Psychrobacter sp. 1Y1 TaxID=3453574 RepID=UPI003F472CDC
MAGTLLTQLKASKSSFTDSNHQSTSIFVHGVASGDPLADRVILWTRVTHESNTNNTSIFVEYIVATDQNFENIVAKGKALATSESDFTIKVDPHLPKPNRTYYYKFQALGYISPVGRTRTLPHSELSSSQVGRVRLAVVSCSNYGFGYFNGYANIAKQADISAVLHLGDYIYEHAEGVYRDQSLTEERPIYPKNEIFSLKDYRQRYACYRTDTDLQECHRQRPFITVWDDHEIADNVWKNGDKNSKSISKNYLERKMAAVQAYHEWMPIRDDNTNSLDSQLRIYRNFEFGKLFDLSMLDTRIFGRQKQNLTHTNKPKRQLLGIEQENWLYQKLMKGKSRSATWHILGQQVIVAPFKRKSGKFSSDSWDGYSSARNRLLDFIEDNILDNIIFLSGDIHASLAFDICKNPFDISSYDPDSGNGSIAVEFVCPSMTSFRSNELAGQDINPHQKFNNHTEHGYMLLDITEKAFQCEWHYTNTLKKRNASIYFAKGLVTRNKANHLVEASQSRPINNVKVPATSDS